MGFFSALIKHLPGNFVACFRNAALVWYGLAALLTYGLVMSGTDWSYYLATRGLWLQSVSMFAAIGGFFLPVVIPAALYWWGWMRKRALLMRTGGASAQAVVLAWIISSLFKAFTGRTQPYFHTIGTVDISRDFHFGFWEHGIFWGWPSSHVSVSCALAAVLIIYLRGRAVMQLLVLLYALFIAVGVSVSIHWLSDALAGIIVGTLVGLTVGKRGGLLY